LLELLYGEFRLPVLEKCYAIGKERITSLVRNELPDDLDVPVSRR
jgi:hypothetical protein